MKVTVVEMADFTRRSKALMTDAERMELIDTLSSAPDAGVSLGHGLYKARFARQGEGKSGGYCTIHYYRPDTGPLLLLTMFAKNEKANLSAGELALLTRLAETAAATYRRQQ
jgi:hypothetical protein